MRILDENSDKSLEHVILYLTLSEAGELKDSLEDLMKNPTKNHTHISDDEFQKEMTLCIYDPNDLSGFNKRSIELILHDDLGVHVHKKVFHEARYLHQNTV